MNLENLNLVELNAQEVRNTEGGWFGPVVGIVAGYILWETVQNLQSSHDAYQRGYNSQGWK